MTVGPVAGSCQTVVNELADKGMKPGEIRERILGRYGYSAIAQAISRARSAGLFIERPALPPCDSKGSRYENSDARNQWRRNAEAGILHLIDLKRAGHSPKQTELRFTVDSDRPLRLTRTPEMRSYMGSSAALASELGW